MLAIGRALKSAQLDYLFVVDVPLYLVHLLLQHVQPDVLQQLPLQLLLAALPPPPQVVQHSLQVARLPAPRPRPQLLAEPFLQLPLLQSEMPLGLGDNLKQGGLLPGWGLVLRNFPGGHSLLWEAAVGGVDQLGGGQFPELVGPGSLAQMLEAVEEEVDF